MHTDEAVNAYILGDVLKNRVYRYDNNDRHGPALTAIAFPVVRLCGAATLGDLNESMLRLTPVWAGTLLIFLIALTAGVANGNQILSTALAGLFWALYSLPVYYSRYFIHEIPFIAATLGFLLLGWKAFALHSRASAIGTGICAGLMVACKETAFLSFAPAAAAGFISVLLHRQNGSYQETGARKRIATLMAALVAFLAVTIAFYSWGGQNWQGLLDLAQSIPKLTARASGQGHEKPFLYYLKLLTADPSGWAVLILALMGAIQSFRACWPWERFLVFYSIGVFLVYSFIPYKTPWLGLNLWLPLVLLAGSGSAVCWDWAKQSKPSTLSRCSLVFLGLLLLGFMANGTWKRVFLNPSDERNPYAYAHTGEDLLRLPGRLSQLSTTLGKSAADLKIAVIAADPWPLPWYLRSFPNTGFWQPTQSPGTADLYLTSMEASDLVSKSQANWRPEFFGIRPGVLAILWTPPLPNSHE